jgi:hypothetical protein
MRLLSCTALCQQAEREVYDANAAVLNTHQPVFAFCPIAIPLGQSSDPGGWRRPLMTIAR